MPRIVEIATLVPDRDCRLRGAAGVGGADGDLVRAAAFGCPAIRPQAPCVRCVSRVARWKVFMPSSLTSTLAMSGAPEKAKPRISAAAPSLSFAGALVMFDFTAISVSGRISSGLNATPGAPGWSGQRGCNRPSLFRARCCDGTAGLCRADRRCRKDEDASPRDDARRRARARRANARRFGARHSLQLVERQTQRHSYIAIDDETPRLRIGHARNPMAAHEEEDVPRRTRTRRTGQ